MPDRGSDTEVEEQVHMLEINSEDKQGRGVGKWPPGRGHFELVSI